VRLPPHRHDPHHAQTAGRNTLSLNQNFPDGFSGNATVPNNITLPPKCPELNAMENIWKFIRQNWLSIRVFRDHDDIVDNCCHTWNRLIDQRWRITSIVLRDCASVLISGNS
jgi:transposase